MNSIAMSKRCGFALAVLLTVALVSAASVSAQESRGTIRGTITDSSNALVPKATVKITSAARGTTVTVESNDAGLYQVPYLIPGSYGITAEATGFKKYVREKIVLRVGEVLIVDIQLQVGTITQVVVVTEAASQLEVTSASASQVIDAKRMAELPIPHGEPYKLLGLSPGTAFARDPRLDRPYEPTHIVGYTMDGVRANRSDLTIDGAPSTATANAGEVISSYVPPQDLVAEFRVQTATFDAQFGNTEGGVTSIQIKSGTKDFHGTVSYTNMTPNLFANDFFANRSGLARADFFYHRFGGTVTGPVWIPKVYDGRKRTFFTYGYEGIREARPRNNGTPTIPSLAMQGIGTPNGNADFSAFLPLGATYVIYDPATGVPSGSLIARTAFPGNIIPAARISPVARALVTQYWPAPTSTATGLDGLNNFLQPNMVENAVYGSHTARLDHNFTDRHKIFGRASWYRRASDYNNYFHNIATGQTFFFISRQAIADYVWTMSSTMVLNAHYAYNRFVRTDQGNPASAGFDLTSVGFPAAYNGLINAGTRRFPRFDFAGYQGTGTAGEFRPNDIHSIAATLTKVWGSHAVRGGFEFRSYRENDFFYANNQTGQFVFDGSWTRGPLSNSPNPTNNIAHAWAAFMLGLPTTATISVPASYAEQSITWGFFAQDDWKVNNKLSLNIGLRWEFETPMTERFNRSVRQLDTAFVQPIEAAAKAAYIAGPGTPEVPGSAFAVRGGLTFAGVNGNPRGLYEAPKVNLMPRLGFAYSLDSKTVVRGGYGIFFGFLGQRRGDVSQSGFSANTSANITTNNFLSPIETMSNPFQAGLVLPQGAAQGGTTFLGQAITFFNPKPLMPYMQRWELGLQRELPGGFFAEMSYIGNRGTHVEISQNLNVTPQKYLSTLPARDTTTINYLAALIANPFTGLMPLSAVSGLRGTTIARERLLRPFPQFDSVNTSRHDGYSWYHSLQMRLEKRFSKGYTINATYTFSKFMQATELLNQDDASPTEMISDMDFPHRFALSWIYELPFGKGKYIGSNVNTVLNTFIGDWQLQGVWQYQSGNPIGNFGDSIYFGDLGKLRLSKDMQTPEKWFNTQGFVALRTGSTVITSGGQTVWVDFNDPCKTIYNAVTCPGVPLTTLQGFNRDGSLQLANHVRTFPMRFGFLRTDTINNWDLSLLKKININERFSFQFRAEFLNAFNHPWLPAPNVTVTGATFGQAIASNQRNYQRRTQLGLKFIF